MLRLSVAQYPTFGSERGREQLPERNARILALQPLRFRQNVPQSSAVTNSPQQQQDSPGEEKGRGVAAEHFDSFDPPGDYRNLKEPEKRERQSHASRYRAPMRPGRHEKRVQSEGANPCLNAEPPAGNDRAKHRRNVRPAHSEACPAHHRERDPVFRSSVCVENHRDEYDDVSEENRHERLATRSSLPASVRTRACRW